MLNKTTRQAEFTKWTGGALIVAALLLISLVVWRASSFIGNDFEGTKVVLLGPLKLLSLGRERIDGQLAATISYHIGLLWYFLLFTAAGALAAHVQTGK